MKVVVLLNEAAGADAASPEVSKVREAFAAGAVAADVRACSPRDLRAAIAAAAASGVDAVVIGGGDGTLNAAAQVLVGGPTALGVLPLGTLNHFAKDVGIPLDLADAVATIAAGDRLAVDVGEVNGRFFLNNASIGLYPAAVREREELRHKHGGGKWVAMLQACFDVFRRYPLLSVVVRTEDQVAHLKTPFVFVGNNRYEMSLFSLGSRQTLRGGELSVYLSRDGGRVALVRQALRALLGTLEQDRDFRSLVVTEMEIDTRRRHVRVAVDGEVVEMASPIRYRIHPQSIWVLAPRTA